MNKHAQSKKQNQPVNKSGQTKKTVFVVSAVLLLLAFVLGAYIYDKQRQEQAAKLAEHNLSYLVRAHAPSEGTPEAKVHIVEFFDPACGTCREFYPLVKELMAANRGKVRLSLRYAPFHPGSDNVVRILEAARKQGKFWETLETVLESQPYWAPNHRAEVERVWPQLTKLGLDIGRLQRDMYVPEVDRVLAQDTEDAKALNVTMTPEYFVNGRPLPDFGYPQLKKLVESAVSSAY